MMRTLYFVLQMYVTNKIIQSNKFLFGGHASAHVMTTTLPHPIAVEQKLFRFVVEEVPLEPGEKRMSTSPCRGEMLKENPKRSVTDQVFQ